MKIEEEGMITTISEGRFLPRFVRYFAASSIACGVSLLICGTVLLFSVNPSIFQTIIAFFLSIAAVCYGVYLLFLFPDVRVRLDRDKKSLKAEIVTRRLWDKKVRELEIRRITGLLVESSEGSSGNDIYRIAFKTYKGEVIPLSGSWTEDGARVEADARKIHAALDPACSLDLPKSLHKAPQNEPSTRRPTTPIPRPAPEGGPVAPVPPKKV
jgi:hypothetical protein